MSGRRVGWTWCCRRPSRPTVGSGSTNAACASAPVDTDGKKGTKTASVTATDGHLFWVPELHAWIDAIDLHPGQWLRTSTGTYVQVTAVKRWTQHASVRNLTVADLHTYYVVAGATPVLVHNCNRAGLDFTDAERQKVYDANAAKNGGEHNGAVACRRCNRGKSTKTMEDWTMSSDASSHPSGSQSMSAGKSERLYKVAFDLPDEIADWARASSERLWTGKTSVQMEVQVRNTPFYAKGIAFGTLCESELITSAESSYLRSSCRRPGIRRYASSSKTTTRGT